MPRHAPILPLLLLLIPACAASRPHLPVPAPAVVPVDLPQPPLTEALANPAPERLPALASDTGEATFYASLFDGRRTASGTIFRNHDMVAAHRDYPFGTLLRVTNLRNGREVVVEVVDRGPHGTSQRARATIIDLSQRAADLLDFIRHGRTPVQLDVLLWGGDR